jgi:hypothetical protein
MKFKIAFVLAAILAGVALTGLGCRHDPATMSAARKPIYYTCPMHPSVKVAAPANCPICGMKLVPAYTETDNGSAGPCGAINCAAPGATNHP